ncbi:MAG: exodeoxyribonuclease VII large subunit [Planctomycetales bacterium]|nr:exodeoxyribonuclease VII large subunit [Planctomycetales bacterium]
MTLASNKTSHAAITDEPILSVAELTAQVKELLETAFPRVWVAGEISNFARPQSGHCYFTLKDDQAQMRAVMWRGAASRVRFPLEDGLEVVCRGHVDLYAPRGSYQLVVEEIHPQGMGALELALRKLRERLEAEGLFDASRKRPLPAFPRRIAFVTSPTGAAIRDFLEVLRRRFPGVEVLVVPARVQGEGAAAEIAAGIAAANRLRPAPDVLVVGRGGGSLEDLWCFNEEIVIRAIAASGVPVISAVGHEIDVTLADLAADVRALTPSEAAERVVPASEDLRAVLRGYQQRLSVRLRSRLQQARAQVDGLAARRVFSQPMQRIHDEQRRLDELAARASRAIRHALRDGRRRVDHGAGKIESLSPLGVLARGYSVTQTLADARVIRDADELSVGEQMVTRFFRGRAISQVQRVDFDAD